MSIITSSVSFSQGVFLLDGQRRLLLTAEYPFFRDEPSNWKDRLSKLKSMGLEIITCYIPWRHHQPQKEIIPDFDGSTQPNRNILGFIDLCKSLGLLLIVKPGPFIHAETNYGGLPDWVCPLQNPAIEPMLNYQMKAAKWSGAKQDATGLLEKWPLPAPFGSEFQKYTNNWFTQVSQKVIFSNQYPNGPVVMVQLGNEGIYSNAQHAIWDFDYSSSGKSQYRLFLQNKYLQLSAYNHLYKKQEINWQKIEPPFLWKEPIDQTIIPQFQDWGEFQAEFMSKLFTLWKDTLNLRIPMVVNVNPPVGENFGIDSWFSRVEPERWNNIQYGFTNWIGDISANTSAFNRYSIAAKRSPGPNLEENWGFSQIYDPAYKDTSTSFYQTLTILNSGATGFNIYTGVGTSFEDKSLDISSSLPYPDNAPITENGEITDKARFIGWLTDFFSRYGDEFLTSNPKKDLAWGYYLPDARVNAWAHIDNSSKNTVNSENPLMTFQNHARQLNIDYELINIQQIDMVELCGFQKLIITESKFLETVVKQKLSAYVKSGGQLAILGQCSELEYSSNYLDEKNSLGSRITFLSTEELAKWIEVIDHPRIIEGQADIWIRSHPQKDVHFITVLFPKGNFSKVKFSTILKDRPVNINVQATPSGGAILRLENGCLTDCIIKGINKYLNVSVNPFCCVNDKFVGLKVPADFSLISGISRQI